MKTRNGFVSNSSSSSFCILGVEVDNETYDKVSSIGYKERTPTTLDAEFSISCEDYRYIGYNPEKLGDDETLNQFKDRLVAEAAKLGITVDKSNLSWITDGGYNG
jgi:hypothetical protein